VRRRGRGNQKEGEQKEKDEERRKAKEHAIHKVLADYPAARLSRKT